MINKKQLRQAHVLRKFNERAMSREAAAVLLGLSERQVSRLAKGMREQGEEALIHGNTGRRPARALTEARRAEITEIRRRDVYAECNIRHFRELLEREHGISVSYSTLYHLLKSDGMASPKKHRKTKAHRRRKRKASPGELLQIDATPYDWFRDGNMYALHGAIDDADGRLTGLYMTKNECLHGYFRVMHNTCLNFGVPLAVYSDMHTIFRSPLTQKKEEAGEEASLTQFGRALAELGIEIIHAHSPQAKGRIERVWDTLQSRLPVEFRVRGITTVEAANEFLANEYIALFNGQFAVLPESEPIFVPWVRGAEIDDILCVKEHRKTDRAGSFLFKRQAFKVLDEGYPLIPAKASIEVLVGIHDAVRVRYKGHMYKTVALLEPPACQAKPKRTKDNNKAQNVTPHLIHSSDEWKKVWHYERYDETLSFIYDLFFKPDGFKYDSVGGNRGER